MYRCRMNVASRSHRMENLLGSTLIDKIKIISKIKSQKE